MALPAFAALEDLTARMGPLSDMGRAQAAIDDASALIHFESNEVWVDGSALLEGVPPITTTICCNAARRVLDNPSGLASQTVGPFSETFTPTSNDVYLSKSEVQKIRAAAGLSKGVWTLATTRSDIGEDVRSLYIDVAGSDKPMPLVDYPL